MIRAAAALVVPLVLASSTARAESEPEPEPEPEPPTWTVQVDPLTTALGFVHVQIERALSPRFSLYAGPHALLFRGILAEPDENQTGFGVELGVRYFILARPRAPVGLWAQVRGVIARVTHDDDVEPGGYVSALVGYTHVFAGRWVLAGGLGVQYIHYSAGGVGPEGVLPAAHTAVGVAF